MPDVTLTARQREILEYIDESMRNRGYPPSVREIGTAVGLTSPSTVHNHLNTLQRLGFIRRNPTKPRAIEVRFDPLSGAPVERRPVRHIPVVGDVAAGTDVLAQENIEETLPVPADLTGDGDLFILRVRGDSMIEAGILDGDLVVARSQPTAERGDIVVAGIPGEEATVKTYNRRGHTIVLEPANARLSPMEFAGRRGDDLRQGRHRHAPPLATGATAPGPRQNGVVRGRRWRGLQWGASALLVIAATSACLLTAPEPHARSTTDEGPLRRWDLMAIGAPAAWARGAAGQGQLIAIVDSGIDLDHPDLAGARPGGRRLHRHGRRSGALPRHRRRRRRPRHPRGRHRRGDRPRGRAPRDPGPRRGLRGRALPGRGTAPVTWPPASSGPPPPAPT